MASVTGSGWAAGGKRMRLTRGLLSIQSAAALSENSVEKTKTFTTERTENTEEDHRGTTGTCIIYSCRKPL
jgi:hypothetical protein